MALKLFSRKPRLEREARQQRGKAPGDYLPSEPIALETDPLQQCLQLERYGLILRQRERCEGPSPAAAVFDAAAEAVDRRFAIVPEGFVSLTQSTADYPGCPETDVETEPFLLAIGCVTHRQFQNFVDAGGYEDLTLWPRDIWPHLIDFKDQTGQNAPRFWRDGRHDQRLADHPVVGISYYEAAAYAYWAGCRLPTAAEWQMAASWRLRSSAHVLRRYPWGDAFDPRKCNIWASNVGHTVPVLDYEPGAAPNGVLQLVGNVWEWTDSDYEIRDETGRLVVGDMILKEIRGGAFDTYFAAQASSCFRTGLASLRRMHNVGFRCVLDLPRPAEEKPQGETQ